MSQNNADNKVVTLSPTPNVSVIHKATVGIEVKINRLKETKGIDLTNNEANVFLVINTSCTVDNSVYTNTEMQRILTRLLALGQRFSPDGCVKLFSASLIIASVSAMSVTSVSVMKIPKELMLLPLKFETHCCKFGVYCELLLKAKFLPKISELT